MLLLTRPVCECKTASNAVTCWFGQSTTGAVALLLDLRGKEQINTYIKTSLRRGENHGLIDRDNKLKTSPTRPLDCSITCCSILHHFDRVSQVNSLCTDCQKAEEMAVTIKTRQPGDLQRHLVYPRSQHRPSYPHNKPVNLPLVTRAWSKLNSLTTGR